MQNERLQTETREQLLNGSEMKVIDGADYSLVDVFSLMGAMAGVRVSRSPHVGKWNTITAGIVYGSGSTKEGVIPYYPRIIMHESQPGKTRDDNYPNHIFTTADGHEIKLSDTENGSPALYFRWKEGAQEQLAKMGYQHALNSASPAQFYLHATLSPDGQRFQTMSEYLIDQSEIDMHKVMQVAAEEQPERFYKLVDSEGNYYDLTEVGKEEMVYKNATNGKMISIPRAKVADRAYEYLRLVSVVAKDPSRHISDIQKEPGVLVDSVFLVVAMGIIESLETNSSVVMHASGTQMYRYLTEGNKAAKERQENIRRLYSAVYAKLGNETPLKKNVDFVIFPTKDIAPFTVVQEMADTLSQAIEKVKRVNELRSDFKREFNNRREQYQIKVIKVIDEKKLPELAGVVRKNFPDFPIENTEKIIANYPDRIRAEIAKFVVSQIREHKEGEIEKGILKEFSNLNPDQVVETVLTKYNHYYNHTKAKKQFDAMLQNIKPEVIRELKTANYLTVMATKIKELGIADLDSDGVANGGQEVTGTINGNGREEAISEAETGVKEESPQEIADREALQQLCRYMTFKDPVYQQRIKILNSAADVDDWVSYLETKLPELSPRQVFKDVRARLENETKGEIVHKIAHAIVKEDKTYDTLADDLKTKLGGVADEELPKTVAQEYGADYRKTIPDVITNTQSAIIQTLVGNISLYYAQRDPEIQAAEEKMLTFIREAKADLDYVQRQFTSPGRELTQFDGPLYIHPLGLQSPMRRLPEIRQELVQISTATLEDLKKADENKK